jgi:dephospho-CoA kinase
MNPHGIEQLIDNDYSHRMILVRVESPTDTRIKRYMARLGKSPTEHQLSEAFLRLNRDIDDFEKFDAKTVYTFDGGRYGKYKIPIIDVDNSGDYDFNDNINWILSEVSECQGD